MITGQLYVGNCYIGFRFDPPIIASKKGLRSTNCSLIFHLWDPKLGITLYVWSQNLANTEKIATCKLHVVSDDRQYMLLTLSRCLPVILDSIQSHFSDSNCSGLGSAGLVLF